MSDTNTSETTPNPVSETPGNPSVEPFGKTDSSFHDTPVRYTPSATSTPFEPPSYPAVSSPDGHHIPIADTAAPYQHDQPPSNWSSHRAWQQDSATAPSPTSVGPRPGGTWGQNGRPQGSYAPPPTMPTPSVLAATGYGHNPDDMSKPLYGATFSQAVVRFFSR